MTKDGLIWVEPSKTTVEGLAALIDGLTARVSALENDRVTEQELADAVKAEADRAKEAEKALDDAIKAIDLEDTGTGENTGIDVKVNITDGATITVTVDDSNLTIDCGEY
jgi:outer membrane murein-binding lipoprotein Lpp